MKYDSTIKTVPATNSMRNIALGKFLSGSIASSESVVTASNPNKLKINKGTPTNTSIEFTSGLIKGKDEINFPVPAPFNTPLIERIIKKAIVKICMATENILKFTVTSDSASMEIATFIGGNLFTSIFLAIIILANFSAAAAHTASGSRVLYAMGRDNVLPRRVFGYISPRFQTPVYNILLIALFCLLALFITLETATSFVSFGALLAFTFVNISVVFHYFIKNNNRNFKGIILYLVLPIIGAILTTIMLVQLDVRTLILGASWVLLGIGYLAYITKGFKHPPPELEFNREDDIKKSV